MLSLIILRLIINMLSITSCSKMFKAIRNPKALIMYNCKEAQFCHYRGNTKASNISKFNEHQSYRPPRESHPALNLPRVLIGLKAPLHKVVLSQKQSFLFYSAVSPLRCAGDTHSQCPHPSSLLL